MLVPVGFGVWGNGFLILRCEGVEWSNLGRAFSNRYTNHLNTYILSYIHTPVYMCICTHFDLMA